jgi:hypothetical protein
VIRNGDVFYSEENGGTWEGVCAGEEDAHGLWGLVVARAQENSRAVHPVNLVLVDQILKKNEKKRVNIGFIYLFLFFEFLHYC